MIWFSMRKDRLNTEYNRMNTRRKGKTFLVDQHEYEYSQQHKEGVEQSFILCRYGFDFRWIRRSVRSLSKRTNMRLMAWRSAGIDQALAHKQRPTGMTIEFSCFTWAKLE